jgi:hypothetical protein
MGPSLRSRIKKKQQTNKKNTKNNNKKQQQKANKTKKKPTKKNTTKNNRACSGSTLAHPFQKNSRGCHQQGDDGFNFLG